MTPARAYVRSAGPEGGADLQTTDGILVLGVVVPTTQLHRKINEGRADFVHGKFTRSSRDECCCRNYKKRTTKAGTLKSQNHTQRDYPVTAASFLHGQNVAHIERERGRRIERTQQSLDSAEQSENTRKDERLHMISLATDPQNCFNFRVSKGQTRTNK